MVSPKHIRHNKEAHVRAADVHLVEMGDAAVARSHRDVLELDVHVVLCLEQLAAVDLPGCDFERDDVALCGSALAFSLCPSRLEWHQRAAACTRRDGWVGLDGAIR